MLKYIKIVVFTALLVPALSIASEPPEMIAGGVLDCPDPRAETPLAIEYGSAGIIQNLAGHPDSIREVAGRLLEEALTSEAADPAGCGSGCRDSERAEVVYRVAPMSLLAAEDQHEVCIKLDTETKEKPLVFEPREFETVDALNDWIMDFSQGWGEDGKLLYERCYSNCSPRYTFLIAEHTSGYAVRTEVHCGLARDRSNDQYRISTALRRSCPVN
ncbi:MAG: hypothetical protein O7B81_17115 [Gammaproteobacteria bacterium]|nr:hypothetical protein [Gammaproteobacteria bacterium]